MINRKELAAKAFDEIKKPIYEQEKEAFIKSALYLTSDDETHETLAKKAEIVKELMAKGVDFHMACDDTRVYIGKPDSSYIYENYILRETPTNYEDWLLGYFRRQAR